MPSPGLPDGRAGNSDSNSPNPVSTTPKAALKKGTSRISLPPRRRVGQGGDDDDDVVAVTTPPRSNKAETTETTTTTTTAVAAAATATATWTQQTPVPAVM